MRRLLLPAILLLDLLLGAITALAWARSSGRAEGRRDAEEQDRVEYRSRVSDLLTSQQRYRDSAAKQLGALSHALARATGRSQARDVEVADRGRRATALADSAIAQPECTFLAPLRAAIDSLRVAADSSVLAHVAERDTGALQLDTEHGLRLSAEASVAELVQDTVSFHISLATAHRAAHPRCGRKCGAVLGAGGILAAAWGLDQIRGRR